MLFGCRKLRFFNTAASMRGTRGKSHPLHKHVSRCICFDISALVHATRLHGVQVSGCLAEKKSWIADSCCSRIIFPQRLQQRLASLNWKLPNMCVFPVYAQVCPLPPLRGHWIQTPDLPSPMKTNASNELHWEKGCCWKTLKNHRSASQPSPLADHFTSWDAWQAGHSTMNTQRKYYPPGNESISHFGKRKIIDSNVIFNGIC